jgi:hypothetical protein
MQAKGEANLEVEKFKSLVKVRLDTLLRPLFRYTGVQSVNGCASCNNSLRNFSIILILKES